MKLWQWWITRLSLREGDRVAVRYQGGREDCCIIRKIEGDMLRLTVLQDGKKRSYTSVRRFVHIRPASSDIREIVRLPQTP